MNMIKVDLGASFACYCETGFLIETEVSAAGLAAADYSPSAFTGGIVSTDHCWSLSGISTQTLLRVDKRKCQQWTKARTVPERPVPILTLYSRTTRWGGQQARTCRGLCAASRLLGRGLTESAFLRSLCPSWQVKLCLGNRQHKQCSEGVSHSVSR